MKPETAELEKAAFTSEHRTFAEKEGYDLVWSPYEKGWWISTPRPLRKGEKLQYFKNIGMAWEVAAIRAGRKLAHTAPPGIRPRMEHIRQPPKGRR